MQLDLAYRPGMTMTVLCRAAEVPAGYKPDNRDPVIQLASNEAQELWLLQLPHEANVEL